MSFERIGVVGGGLMGAGIAEVCARADCDTIVVEVNDAAADAAQRRIETSLGRAVKAGKLDEPSMERALSYLLFTTDFRSLHDRQFVVEAVIENEAAKTEVFHRLDDVVTDPTAVLASNTSSIPIMKLAMATDRPAQSVNP